MSQPIKTFFLLSAVFALASAGLTAKAEEELFLDSDKDVEGSDGGGGCFSLYRFGSVNMPFQGESESVAAGTDMTFRGTVVNRNDYPIVDGMVYAKVFRKTDPTNLAKKELVDRFVAVKDLHMAGKGESPMSFSWKVPSTMPAGDYVISLFFATSKKFNLTGLSFTQDVTGNSFDFSVTSDFKSGVGFPNDSVTVNGNPYYFNAFIPKVGKTDSIDVKAVLDNGTSESQKVDITWKLYRWDALDESNLIGESKQEIVLGSLKKESVSYRIDNMDHSVYLLVGEAIWKDSKSVLEVRVGREDVDALRINFPSITSFPLRRGEKTTLFSCLHNAGTNHVVKDGKLVLSIKDMRGQVVHESVYNGDVSGSMMVHKEEFVPKGNYDVFTLSAELYQKGKKVDSASVRYDCALMGSDVCAGGFLSKLKDKKSESSGGSVLAYALLAVCVIGLILIPVLLRRRGTHAMLFILGTASLLTFGAVRDVEAKDVIVGGNSATDRTLYRSKYIGDDPDGLGLKALETPAWSVQYIATVKVQRSSGTSSGIGDVTSIDGGLLSDGAKVSIGDTLTFTPERGTITWNGTGYMIDSPYGQWIEDAEAPPVQCLAKDHAGTSAYIPFSVHPDRMRVRQAGTAQLDCNPDKTVCTVKSTGTIVPVFSFDRTYGKFYFRTTSYGSCRAPNEDRALFVYCVNGNGTNCQTVEIIPEDVDGIRMTYRARIPQAEIRFNMSVPEPQNGSCGPSDGQTMLTAPTTGLCKVGTASAVTGNGPWHWNCSGLYGGSSAYCSAYKTPPPTLTFTADSTNLAYDTATTLRWTSANATSCVASRTSDGYPNSWQGTKTLSGTESTGNLKVSKTYFYTLACSGQGGSVSRTILINVGLPPLAVPGNFRAQCNVAGNLVTLNWDPVAGATQYLLRVDDKSNGWTGTCASVNPGDTCRDDIFATSFTRGVVPSRDYKAWIHSFRSSDRYASGAAAVPFRCDPPVCTGAVPQNAMLCEGDGTGLTVATSNTVASVCSRPTGSNPKCQYICNEGYEPSGNICVPIVCKGARIANADLCRGDDVDLKPGDSNTLAESCSSPEGSVPKCQFVCKDGYVKNGNACVAVPDLTVDGPAEYRIDIKKPVNINASIRNSGAAASSLTTYSIKVDTGVIASGSVPALAPGGTFQVPVAEWLGATGTSIHPFTVEVARSAGETDTGDNVLRGNILVTCIEDDSCTANTCASDTCVTKCGNERSGKKDCSYKEVTP